MCSLIPDSTVFSLRKITGSWESLGTRLHKMLREVWWEWDSDVSKMLTGALLCVYSTSKAASNSASCWRWSNLVSGKKECLPLLTYSCMVVLSWTSWRATVYIIQVAMVRTVITFCWHLPSHIFLQHCLETHSISVMQTRQIGRDPWTVYHHHLLACKIESFVTINGEWI